MNNIKVNYKVLNKLMSYVRDHGTSDRDFYRVLKSGEYTLRWSRGHQEDGLQIKLKEDKEDIWKCEQETEISRFLPNPFIYGDFYEALDMARKLFEQDSFLYELVNDSYEQFD